MVPCELPPVHLCRKVSSSSKGSAGSVRAAAERLALTDMLQIAPRLLQSLSPKSMAALSSTSKQLRCMVHEHVTSISIIQHNGYGNQFQMTELQVLTSGNWPHLQSLNIKYRAKLQTAAIRQLSKASWSSLTSLDLSRNCLSKDAISKLVVGKWPALKCLNLSHNRLDTAAIALLNQAHWPLEELRLDDNRVDVEAMGVLIQGSWPKLVKLTLEWNTLRADSIAVLAKVRWPLQHLDLKSNHLNADAMTYLGRGRQPDLEVLAGAGNVATPVDSFGKLCESAWPQLVSLTLSCSSLGGADVAGLCTAHWPKLSMVDLAANFLDELSMMHLIKTDWPELKHLNLNSNWLDDAAVQVLSHNSWHKLEGLDLQGNGDVIRLQQSAISFLRTEQQRVALI